MALIKLRSLLTLMIGIFLLAACGGRQEARTTPIPGVEVGGPPPPAATAQPSGPTPPALAPARCTVIKLAPTQGPTEESLFPPVSEVDWVLGPPDAALTILEYSEMQCPYCAQFEPVATRLQQAYPEDVRLVFRHFPLEVHDKSLLAAQAVEAAGIQDKALFFALKDSLFAQQATWVKIKPAAFETWLTVEAAQIGLDPERFAVDLKSEAVVQKVRRAHEEALRIQLPGTPFVLLNGAPYQGPRDTASLESILKLFLLEERQYNECPPLTIDPANSYTATIETEIGDIVVELFAEQAPTAVNNFIFLARAGWYKGVAFHRVLPGFVAQAGDPSGTGYGGPGYAFADEITPELTFDRPGMLAMANAGADTNGSQFFITLGDTQNLDGKYTIFGKVVKGLEIAQRLTPRDPSEPGDLPRGTVINAIRIEER